MTSLVLVLNLAPVATNVYLYSQRRVHFTADPVLGTYCGNILTVPAITVLHLTIGTRVAVIIADILVVALTWHKTFRHRMEAIRVGVRTPLSALLLRDGTVYFAAFLAMNIAQVLVATMPSLQNVAPVGSIILVLTPILISRFLLNLRQLGEPENEIQSCFDPQFSVLGFRVPTSTSIVGNMGADLDHSPAEETDYVAEDADVGSRHDASMDGPAENLPGTPVMEDIFEIQEVPRNIV